MGALIGLAIDLQQIGGVAIKLSYQQILALWREQSMRVSASTAFLVAALSGSLPCGTVLAQGQEFPTPSAWLEQLDREHTRMVPSSGHVHARGQVEAVDIGPGTITLWSGEIQSPDNSIWMPPMRMTFHVTNRHMLRGLHTGDTVAFEVARLRNAVMITRLRKVH